MVSSALPLFPTDDGWPYPDADPIPLGEVGAEVDLDDLELRADIHAFDDLTELEHAVLVRRFGLDRGPALSMKELGPAVGCSRGEARLALGSAIDKLRGRLLA